MGRLIRRLSRFLGAKAKARYLAPLYPQFDIGEHSYGGLHVRQFDRNTKLVMGKYCSLATDVQVMLGGEHRPDWVSTYPFNILHAQHTHFEGHPASKGDVVIGNDVWVGSEAIIMSGVTIGDGAVVAARSVVIKDVPPYGIVGGNPGKLIKYRFDETLVARLLAARWWDWPEERISKAMPLLLQNNMSRFLDAVDNEKI